MKPKFTSHLVLLVVLIMIASTVLVGCGSQPAEQPADPSAAQPVEEATEKATEPPPAEVVMINSAGVELPPDAAPPDQQVLLIAGGTEQPWLTIDSSMYAANIGVFFAWGDVCTRLDRDFLPQPAGCESWELSDDGLTWTFHLPEDKVWSDGTPVTAQDWVLALQRAARPGYDFGWFYSYANIENWNEVTQEEVPPEELGAKAVDDYTFRVSTTRPTPYMDKLFSWLYAVPSHVLEDWMDDDWAFRNDPISSNTHILKEWKKGEKFIYEANDTYTGPNPPIVEQIEVTFMNLDTFWLAYQEGEIDWVNAAQKSTVDQVMADPELQKQVISYPFFETDYLFFDTWNPPFDNLKVRQAFAHAVDREMITNGPFAHLGSPAYTMNPTGFPGENAEAVKSENNFDPELAAKLMAEAGYPDGEGFPKVSMYLRRPEPVVVTTAEAIASMLKKNLGVDIDIQNVERRQFQDMMGLQKREKEGDFQLALVSYMYDFVDGSNFLSVWGGCEPEGETDLSNMPGRHTWYNKEYNDLVCEAGSIMGDEDKRNELYAQAESILIKDAALVPVWHPIKNYLVNPNITGSLLDPDSKGVTRFEWENNLGQLYMSSEEREPVDQ